MSIWTGNDKVSVYASSLLLLPSCQTIGKHIHIGHQQSVTIDYLDRPWKFLIVFFPVKAGRNWPTMESGLINYERMNKIHFHKLNESSSNKHTHIHTHKRLTHTRFSCVSRLVWETSNRVPDPEERRVGRSDRESHPSAKCIISLFVMEQTEPKITVALSAEFWSALNKLSEPSVGASRPELMNMAAEWESQEATPIFLL